LCSDVSSFIARTLRSRKGREARIPEVKFTHRAAALFRPVVSLSARTYASRHGSEAQCQGPHAGRVSSCCSPAPWYLIPAEQSLKSDSLMQRARSIVFVHVHLTERMTPGSGAVLPWSSAEFWVLCWPGRSVFWGSTLSPCLWWGLGPGKRS
jgi:hypothetical protein